MNSDSRRTGAASKIKARIAERHALPAYQSRSRATRAKILAAAEREFAEKGYDGATLADIAESAACSVGAVYFRFKDKSALFLAIAESFAEDARARLGSLLVATKGQDADILIRHFVIGTAESFRRHKGLFRAIVERGLEHPQAMKAMFALRDEFANGLEAILKTRASEHTKRNPALRVRVMTQMIYGFLLTGVINPNAPTRIGDTKAVAELAQACVTYLRDDSR